MKRYSRLNLIDIDVIVSNQIECLEFYRDYSESVRQKAARRNDIMIATEFVVMHHLQADGLPKKRVVVWLKEACEVAIDFFWGKWRNNYEYRGRETVILDAKGCREKLDWFETYREAIFCAVLLDDLKSLAKFWTWPDEDLPYDGGTWDVSQSYNDFHILMALTMRAEKPAARRLLRQSIETGKSKHPKLCLLALDAIQSKDGAALMKVLEGLLAYNLKSEFKPNNPWCSILVEGTIFYHLARMKKIKLPSLSSELADRIVTMETLNGK